MNICDKFSIHRKLDEKEEKEFRQWARNNYKVGDEIPVLWHPVTVNECKKMNKESKEEIKEKERTWCCWMLSESEIEHVAEEVFESGYTRGLITDNELEQIVVDFKKSISNAFDNWKEALEEIIRDNTINSDKRMLKTFKRELTDVQMKRKLAIAKQELEDDDL